MYLTELKKEEMGYSTLPNYLWTLLLMLLAYASTESF